MGSRKVSKIEAREQGQADRGDNQSMPSKLVLLYMLFWCGRLSILLSFAGSSKLSL